MPADLSIVVCSYNRAPGMVTTLRAVAAQTIADRLEVVVVDDGSSDDTCDVARAFGAAVVRHPVNRGVAAARNSGWRAASASVIAFLDDECEPVPDWAEHVLAAYRDGTVAGAGGPLVPEAPPGFFRGYTCRHNPLLPLEVQLTVSAHPLYRLYLYLRRQWAAQVPAGPRDVYALVGANMSFRREVLTDIGGLDERFQIGGEETDLCMRLARQSPSARLVFIPEASVTHHFAGTLRDTLRRSRYKGRGSARLYRRWPGVPPTFYPGPLAMLAVLALCVRFPVLAVAALIMPQLLYAQGMRAAVSGRQTICLLDPYVQLAEETWENAGFVEGIWRFRQLFQEASTNLERLPDPGRGIEHVP